MRRSVADRLDLEELCGQSRPLLDHPQVRPHLVG